MAEIALVSVFAGLPDSRRKQGRRHPLPLCLAACSVLTRSETAARAVRLFTLAVACR